MSLNPN